MILNKLSYYLLNQTHINNILHYPLIIFETELRVYNKLSSSSPPCMTLTSVSATISLSLAFFKSLILSWARK